MKELEAALRKQLEFLEAKATPMRQAMQAAETDLKPLEAKISKLRTALDLVVEAR